MASLQAKHTRGCAGGRAWSAFASATAGCTCPQGPVYYVVVRSGSRSDKIRAGRNRREGDRFRGASGQSIRDRRQACSTLQPVAAAWQRFQPNFLTALLATTAAAWLVQRPRARL